MKTVIEVVASIEGSSLYINGYRVAGPKPWGGGRVVQSWKTDEVVVTKGCPRATSKRRRVDE